MRTVVGIGIGGALGSLARYGLEGFVSRRTPTAFPWGTFAVNLTGAFVVGLLFTILTDRLTVAPWVRSALLIGVLGGYTTFSTFALETYRLIEDGAVLLAAVNASASVFGSLLAVYLGVVVGRAA